MFSLSQKYIIGGRYLKLVKKRPTYDVDQVTHTNKILDKLRV